MGVKTKGTQMNDPAVNDLDLIYFAVLKNNALLDEVLFRLSLLERLASDDEK